MEKVIFRKPVTIDGKVCSEMEFNFDALTGNDLLKAETETRTMGDRTPAISFSLKYQAAVAAQAAKVPVDNIISLPAKEFNQVVLLVQSFLFEQE